MGGETCRKNDVLGEVVAPLGPSTKDNASHVGGQFRDAGEIARCTVRPLAEAPTAEERQTFLDGAAFEAPSKLLDRMVSWREDSKIVGDVIALRPGTAPELVRQAMERGDFESAKWIASEMEARFTAAMGSGVEAESMYLAALELEGDGSDAVRSVMREIVRKRDLAFKQTLDRANTSIDALSDGRGGTYADDKAMRLDAAAKDPGGGRLYARFHTDPAAAAKQLHEEALEDPKAFKRHAGALSTLVWSSPGHAAAMTKEILALGGTASVDVKAWLAAELHEAMGPSMKEIDAGIGAVPQHERLGELMPLLAQVVGDPDVVMHLDPARSTNDRLAPSHLSPMPHLLADLLSPRYADHGDVDGNRVRGNLAASAARLLEMSVLEPDPASRRLVAKHGGKFLGQLTRAEAEAKGKGFGSVLGEMLSAVGSYVPLPGPINEPIEGVGDILKSADSDETPARWAPDVIERLMRRVYESERPRPDGFDDSRDVRQHDAEFAAWESEALNAYVAQLVLHQ